MKKKKSAMDIAVGLLSRRAHSKAELMAKLKKREFPYNECEFAINECLRFNYLDDQQFAEAYTEELKWKGLGPRRIYMALKKKGLDKELIDKMLEKDDASLKEEYERMKEVFKGKLMSLKREPDIRKKREKAYRFLTSRGYTSDMIIRLLDNREWEV